MPEVYLKPLKHKSMAELNQKLTGIDKLVHQRPPDMLIKSALQLPDQGERLLKDGDEEEAYVLFMRFIYLAVEAKKLGEPRKTQLRAITNNAITKKCMERAEQLNKSLERRYKSLADEKAMQNAAFELVTAPGRELVPPAPPSNGFAGATDAKKAPEYSDEINCSNLFELINRFRGTNSLVVMDVRSEADFQESHLDAPCVISVPESIIKVGTIANRVEEHLPTESKNLWRQRKGAEYVVLIDWWSNLRNVAPLSAIATLKTILLKWDVGVAYKRDPLILAGGYSEWLECYPSLTTNSQVKPKHSPDNTDDLICLDDIEYPDFQSSPSEKQPQFYRELKPTPLTVKEAFVDAVKLEPEPAPMPPSLTLTDSKIPTVDRASKQQAIEKMERQHEEVLNKTLETQRELLNAEKKLEEWRQRKEEEATKEAQQMKEQQYLDEIKRLETHCSQLDLENAELKNKIQTESGNKRIKAKKDIEIDQMRALTKKMADNRISDLKNTLTPNTNKLTLKIERNNKPTPKFEPLKREPSEASNLSRSHSSPNIKDMDDDMPQFDRSIKPPARMNNEAFVSRVTNRDLSPVYGTKGRGLTGLKNLGNSCYMNSIVQCISNTIELADYLCKGAYRNDVNMSTKTKGQIVEELAVVIRALWAGEYRTVACRDFKRVAGACHGDFGGVRQQDSHEFLTLLMDWLHDGLNKRHHMKRQVAPAAAEPEGPPVQVHDVEESAEKGWREFERCNESRILHLFYGQQSSTVTCNTCGFFSVTFEPFSTLSLVLPTNSDKCSLKDCLDFYLAAEPIQEWRCPACKQNRRATKKFDIWRLPPILVIHFKRFCEDIAWRKQHTLVEFPLQRLQMSAYTKRPNQSHNSYNLYAVSNHYGTMDGGHYTTYSFSREFKKWYKFDDADVSEMSESGVRSNAAYILFYASTEMPTSSYIIPR